MHRFHVDNNEGDLFIGYDVIVGRYLIVQMGQTVNFKHHVIQWDGVLVSMKEPMGLLGQKYLTGREMCKVIIKTSESASTRQYTEIIVK